MKKWYKSRSVWSAILKALSGILASIVLLLNGDASLADLLPGIVSSAWTVIDVIIRFKTTESIG